MHGLAKMDYLPYGHADVEKAHSRHRASDPSRSHKTLPSIKACFACSQNQEVIVAPVAEAEESLGYPGQTREYDPDLEAKYDVEDYRES